MDYISSVGIRSIISLEQKLRSRGGYGVIGGLSANTRQVLDMSGLSNQLHSRNSISEALDFIKTESLARTSVSEFIFDDRKYLVKKFPEAKSFIEYWGSFNIDVLKSLESSKLEAASLEELECSFGIGGFGNSTEQAFHSLGEFVAVRTFAGNVPADGYCYSDYLLNQKPSESVIYIAAAAGISGKASALIDIESNNPITLNELIDGIQKVKEDIPSELKSLTGFIILSNSPSMTGAHYETFDSMKNEQRKKEIHSDTALLIIGISAHSNFNNSNSKLSFQEIIEKTGVSAAGNNKYIHAHGILLDNIVLSGKFEYISEIEKLLTNIDYIKGVANIEPVTLLDKPRVWLFAPEEVRPGSEKRTRIEYEGESGFPQEFDVIIRRIYSDAGRVVLKPLKGGFSSRTFYVNSYDIYGRRQLPTVLKIASQELTQREVDSYKNNVEKFILNNSTTIMGSAQYGEFAGLRYNFLGITGADSRLSWLENIYRERPVDELLPIFDKIFTDILKPWYGQPKLEMFQPYIEHEPAKLFKTICMDAERELGISPENETIECSPLNTTLPNPFHFYKYEFPKRKEYSMPWYKSIIHGDLNMKNIMLDEQENIYIIDFSETRNSNIVSDFARLEPILKFEMTRLETDVELRQLLEFEQALAKPNTLKELPIFLYSGNDPMVEKAYRMICRLRTYADTVTIFETNIVPYLLALLEWTLPVASYFSFPIIRKRLAAYSAGFICKKIFELEGKK
ncbi:MAG: hypothetical protein QG635_1378 [Bacteroidota bacterium]|nr:hypothetical protein [Bacteroidota bacterium]